MTVTDISPALFSAYQSGQGLAAQQAQALAAARAQTYQAALANNQMMQQQARQPLLDALQQHQMQVEDQNIQLNRAQQLASQRAAIKSREDIAAENNAVRKQAESDKTYQQRLVQTQDAIDNGELDPMGLDQLHAQTPFQPLDYALLKGRATKAAQAKMTQLGTQNRIADYLNQKATVDKLQTALASPGTLSDIALTRMAVGARVPVTYRDTLPSFTGIQSPVDRSALLTALADRRAQLPDVNALMAPKTSPADYVTQDPTGRFQPLLSAMTQAPAMPAQIQTIPAPVRPQPAPAGSPFGLPNRPLAPSYYDAITGKSVPMAASTPLQLSQLMSFQPPPESVPMAEVINPQGRQVRIRQSDLQQALKLGYEVAPLSRDSRGQPTAF